MMHIIRFCLAVFKTSKADTKHGSGNQCSTSRKTPAHSKWNCTWWDARNSQSGTGTRIGKFKNLFNIEHLLLVWIRKHHECNRLELNHSRGGKVWPPGFQFYCDHVAQSNVSAVQPQQFQWGVWRITEASGSAPLLFYCKRQEWVTLILQLCLALCGENDVNSFKSSKH